MGETAWKATAWEKSLPGKGKSEAENIAELFQGVLKKSTDPFCAATCLDPHQALALCLLVQLSINNPRKKGHNLFILMVFTLPGPLPG